MKRLALPIFLLLLVFTESGVAQLQKFRAANGVSEKTKEGNP
jgi:hypothetical protein